MNPKQPFYVDVGTSIVAIRCTSNHDVIVRYDHVLHPLTLELAKDVCDRMNREVETHNGSGNCAKLREAMTTIQKIIKLDGDNEPHLALTLISEVVYAALAAPPRNCDVYNNESCRMAYHLNGDGLMTMQAFADWLYAPATEKEGGAK